jgi:PAS domain-containing protein
MNARRARGEAQITREETVDKTIFPCTPGPEAEAEKVKHSRSDHNYGRDSSVPNQGASKASEDLERVWKEREARYRQIVEDQTDPVARLRPDGNLTFVNRVYCRFFNKTDEGLIGKGFFDSMTDEQALELRNRMTLLTPSESTFKCEHEITVTKDW